MDKNTRTFYTLVLTQTLSLIGSRVSGLALGIWVFNQTGNATPLAIIAFFALVPQVVLQGVAGVLADRWDRRYVMAISDAGQALGTVLLLGLFLTGNMQIWHLYVVTFVQALFGVFQFPAFSASVTMLIPDDERDRANAIQQMTGPTAGIIAPILAGLLFAVIGVTGVIILDLVTFVCAFVVVLMVKIPRPRKTEEGAKLSGTVWQEMAGGLRYMRERPALFTIAMTAMVINFTLGLSTILITPYLLARTGSETAYGLILGLFNGGALIGALAIGAWGGTRPRIHTIMPAIILTCVFFMLFGMMRVTWALALVGFIILIPNTMSNTLFVSMIQAKVAPDVQGRVFATLGQMSMLVTPIAYLIAGPLADQVFEPMVGTAGWSVVAPLVGSEAGSGMGLIFVLTSVAAALFTTFIYAKPSVRRLEADLPDYQAQAQPDEIVPEITPSAA